MKVVFALEFAAGETWDSSQFFYNSFLFTAHVKLNNLNYVLSQINYIFLFQSSLILILQVSEGNIPENIHNIFHQTSLTKFCPTSNVYWPPKFQTSKEGVFISMHL